MFLIPRRNRNTVCRHSLCCLEILDKTLVVGSFILVCRKGGAYYIICFSEGRAALGPVLYGLDVNFPVVNKQVFGAVVF